MRRLLHKIVPYVLFLGLMQSAFSQNRNTKREVDSLVRFSIQLEQQDKREQALEIATQLDSFPKELFNDQLRLAHAINLAILQHDHNAAIKILEKELQYFKAKNEPENLSRILNAKGSVYFNHSQLGLALVNMLQADSIHQVSNIKNYMTVANKIGIANVLMQGVYEIEKDKYDKALQYILDGIDVAEEIDFKVGSAILLEKLAHYYRLKKELSKSLEINKTALTISKQIVYPLRETSIYDGLAKTYLELDMPDSAKFYLDKRLDMLVRMDLPLDVGDAHFALGAYYNRMSRFSDAIHHLMKAKGTFDTLPNVKKEWLYNLEDELATAYLRLGEYEESSKSLLRSKKLLKEIQASRTMDRISELEAKYRTDFKEKEIALLKEKNALIIQRQKSLRNLYLGGIGISSVAGIFLFQLFRNRQKTNKKLRELDILKTNFFTNISHEFRTPLTLIASPLQETLSEKGLSTTKRARLKMALRNTDRLLELVNQLLDLSRLDSGYFKIQVAEGNLMEFLKATLEAFAFQAKTKKQKFVTDLKMTKECHWYDTDVVQTILNNLIDNAIKFSPEHANILISVKEEDEILQLKIQNTGVCLSPEEIPNLFSRFYRTGKSVTGTGIGLALVKELVELHKGRIYVYSDSESVTFLIELPVGESAFEQSVKVSAPFLKAINEPVLKRLSRTPNKNAEKKEDKGEAPILLVVDDNEDMRSYVAALFEANFEIITAKNGISGFKQAKKRLPDLIITDLMMPKKDGMLFTENCKTDDRTSHIPIIMLTAKAGDENRLRGLETGADAYLTKPFNNQILKQTVSNLLKNREKLQERFSKQVNFSPTQISIGSYDERFLKILQNVLDNHLTASDFDAGKFAKYLGMSRMQLHRKLKALTGQSTTGFIRTQRLKLAADLLEKSDARVSEIVYTVGFNNHSYFTKIFKDQYGVSPSDYART